MPKIVKVYLASYTLVGKMYHLDSQQINDALNKEPVFMPMTDVEIVSDHDTGAEKAGFVAVNKEKIIYLEGI